MKKFSIIFLFFFVNFLSQSVFLQIPQPTATPANDPESDDIRVSTNLIQVDFVVLDKDNRPVTNLKREDFEIYESGKKQDISAFTYFSSKPTVRSSVPSNDSLGLREDKDGLSLNEKIEIPTTTATSDPGGIRRTMVLVVDNLGLSFRSVSLIKKSLQKFIRDQIREGDLVTIVTTGGASVLPAFTSDKKQLLAIVKGIKWRGQSRGSVDYYDPVRMTLLEEMSEAAERDLPGVREEAALLEDVELDRKNNLAVGTIGALQYIVRGMQSLPGRKALVVFSEGFSLSDRTLRNSSNSDLDKSTETPRPPATNRFASGVPDALSSLIATANQYSVVIYPIDPRGLQYLGMANADDDVRKAFNRNFKPGQTDDARTARDYNFRQSQDGMRVLASETGGFAVLNQNNLDKGLERIIDDQSYYLLGYLTDIETIDNPKDVFENVEIKVKNPDLSVRYRTAFYPDEGRRTDYGPPRSAREKVGQALAYPFRSNEIRLNLYSILGNNPEGTFVRFLINISTEDLKFNRKSAGMRTANFDVLAITLDADEKPLDQFSQNFTVTVNEPTYQNILKKGFVYVLPVGLRKSGVYHFRVAIHDSETGKVGAASKFLETPKFEKKRLWISNLTLRNLTGKDRGNSDEENDKSMFVDTTLRQFTVPVTLSFGAVIYNPQTNENGVPELEMQTRLIQDDKVVFETPFEPISTKDQKDLSRLDLSGRIKLEKRLPAGNYIFQVIVSDKLAKKKLQIATQWIDFEVSGK